MRALPLCAALFLFILSGCGESGTPSAGGGGKPSVHKLAEGAKPKLAFIINNASEFWTPAVKGLEKFQKETGVKVDYFQPPGGKLEEQKQIIEDLINQGYSGMAISPIAPADMTRELNKAAEKMNVICQDSDAPKSNRIAYIGTNNVVAGKELGEALKKLLPDGGKAAVFVGTFSADNASERLRGVEEAIKGSKIEIVEKKEDNTDKAKARANVEDVLKAHPEVNICIGLWSYNTPAIAAAVSNSPRKGKVTIAGFDDEEGTLKGIESGDVAFCVVQKPFEFGYQSSKLLYDLATKGEAALPKNPIIDTGVDVIDAKSLKAYRDKQAEMRK